MSVPPQSSRAPGGALSPRTHLGCAHLGVGQRTQSLTASQACWPLVGQGLLNPAETGFCLNSGNRERKAVNRWLVKLSQQRSCQDGERQG